LEYVLEDNMVLILAVYFRQKWKKNNPNLESCYEIVSLPVPPCSTWTFN